MEISVIPLAIYDVNLQLKIIPNAFSCHNVIMIGLAIIYRACVNFDCYKKIWMGLLPLRGCISETKTLNRKPCDLQKSINWREVCVIIAQND